MPLPRGRHRESDSRCAILEELELAALQQSGAHLRVLRRAPATVPRVTLRSIYRDTMELRRRVPWATSWPSIIRRRARTPLRQVFLSFLLALAHQVHGWPHSSRAGDLQLRRGFVQTRFVTSCRHPHQDLEHSRQAGLLAEGTRRRAGRPRGHPKVPERTKGPRQLDSTTTEAQKTPSRATCASGDEFAPSRACPTRAPRVLTSSRNHALRTFVKSLSASSVNPYDVRCRKPSWLRSQAIIGSSI